MILVSPRNPLNIGAVARAISNFGFSSLRLVDAYRPSLDEAKSAVGASGEILLGAREFGTLAEAVADCELVVGTAGMEHRESRTPVELLELGARVIRECQGSVALLFGSEKRGLSNDDLSYCQRLIRIPTSPAQESMNLGQAVAVCLYELIRSDDRQPGQAPARATSDQLDLMTDRLNEVLEESGYVHSPGVELKTRRLVRRLDLSAHDAEAWLGMLRQIQWRLRNPETKKLS